MKLLLFIFQALQLTQSLHLVHVDIPEFGDIRDAVKLNCSYSMGKNELNSVKWYKDHQEFFRFAPLMDRQISTWTVEGVSLSRENPYSCNNRTCSVSLDSLSTRSSGVYRCEISADAPSFTIVYSDQKMRVVALPRHDPVIQGLQPYYSMGDVVSANCTSDSSHPPANLTWFINDEKVDGERALLSIYETTIDDEMLTLHSRALQIQFRLDVEDFDASPKRIFLKCVASVEQVPHMSRQTSELVYIQSDDLQNLRLINSERGGGFDARPQTVLNFLVPCFVGMLLIV